MRKFFKKNQIIIAVLAIMIAAAGYLNYSGRIFDGEFGLKETNAELANKELLDISEEDVESSSQDIKSQDGEEETKDEDVKGTPGEAVLTSQGSDSIVANAKMTREQTRAKNKETLLKIIDNDALLEDQKQDAVESMVHMTEIAEKEAAAESLLLSKGFADAVVSISKESTDVIISAEKLSEADRAQITDIVARKTGVDPLNIVINPIANTKK